jgi:hypothetical protein
MLQPMLQGVYRQNGYGAHKRGEHCEVCYVDTGRVGTWRIEYSDGTQRFFCNEHVTPALADGVDDPARSEPGAEETQPTP